MADYPDACQVMTLSTNSLYVQAYHDAAILLNLNENHSLLAAEYTRKAESLTEMIRKRFFVTTNGIPAYFIHGTGPDKGKAEAYQEGAGIGFSLMFGIPSPKQAENIFKNIHHEPRGIVVIWPDLRNNYLGSGKTGSTDSGYHTPQNITIWPQINGIWMLGCAQYTQTEMFGSELKNLCRLVTENNGIYEIYHARTGNPKLWGHPAKKDQNWGATAILAAVHHGLFGIDFTENSIRFAPNLPQGWGTMALQGVHCRELELDIDIRGAGNQIKEFLLDGHRHSPELPFSLNGHHQIEIDLQ